MGCKRKFIPESLAKHMKNCKKIFQENPKVFDSFKQRALIEGGKLKPVEEEKPIKKEEKL